MSLPRQGLRGLVALLALASPGSALAAEPAAEPPAPGAAPTAAPAVEPIAPVAPVAAPAVAPPPPAVESTPPPSPRTWRAAVRLEYGTLRKPSDCQNYCEDAYGPALAVSVGWMMMPRLAVLLEGWLFQRDALAAFAGAQYWLGEEGGWVRAGVGVMDTQHQNSDGGSGAGTGPALSLAAGVRLTRFGDVSASSSLRNVSTELAVRFAAVTHDAGTVTALTLGYGIAW